jgi:outer membrane protein
MQHMKQSQTPKAKSQKPQQAQQPQRPQRLSSAAVGFALLLMPAGLFAQQAPISLTLGDAARLAARQSAPAIEADLRTREAEARVTQRRADLLPSVSTSALESGHTLNSATFGFDFPAAPGEKPLLDPAGQIIGPVKTLDVRGQVRVPAIDFAARERVQTARVGVLASKAEAKAAGDQAAAAAAVAYLRVARADALVAARAADSVLADTLLTIAQDQLHAGVGVGLDVTRAQSQLAGIHSQLISARGEAARSRLELVRAIGAPLDASIAIASPLQTMSIAADVPDEAASIALAMTRRADIQAAARELDAGRQGARAIKAEALPTLNAFGDDGAIGKNGSHFLNTYMWGVELSFPVFDGFRRQGKLSEQNAVNAGLEVRRRELERQVSVEVRSAIVNIASARDQVIAARGRLGLAQLEYSQAQDRFKAGVASNADVIAASLSLNGARNLVIDALANYQAAKVDLARAEGIATELP